VSFKKLFFFYQNNSVLSFSFFFQYKVGTLPIHTDIFVHASTLIKCGGVKLVLWALSLS
jgi:hypothetical protein